MFTAINSLNLYQSFMDVVADNLSNANTTAFKTSRMTFQDQISQLVSIGAPPSATLGGTNPVQIGLGSRLGTVSTTFTQGMLQSTGRSTDLSIEGDGFLIYSNGTQQYFSRDGALDLDSAGYLVNSATGMRLQGWQAADAGQGFVVDRNSPLTGIHIPLGTTLAQATKNANFSGNLDSRYLADGTGTYDLTTMVYDSQGVTHSLELNFTKTASNAWSWTATVDGTLIPVAGGGSRTATFDTKGQFSAITNDTITFSPPGTDPVNIKVDLSSLTQLAATSDAAMTTQDGLEAGNLSGFDVISNTGEVLGLYSNGMKQVVGQLAIAKFINPSGLVRAGMNLFDKGLNSGEPEIGIAGSGGRGSVTSGYLEASNVDMAQEFTNMILAQRGFQASSRIITTSDEILQELVNLKR
jgi:flagellar hook protein FlgE